MYSHSCEQKSTGKHTCIVIVVKQKSTASTDVLESLGTYQVTPTAPFLIFDYVDLA